MISLSQKYDDGKPATIYLQPNVRADYYAGCVHPAGPFRMSEKLATSLIPLLKAQPYVAEAAVHQGEACDVDLDLFRSTGIDHRGGYMPASYFLAFRCGQPDLGRPWLSVEPDNTYADRIVVCRSRRYHNANIKYGFLNAYRLVFVGLEDEYQDFRQSCPDAEYAPTADFLALARIIAGAKVFVSNQTAAHWVAEGMKKQPRILELCTFANNSAPLGVGGYAAVGQAGFQWAVEDALSTSGH